jgi:putative membrane protein
MQHIIKVGLVSTGLLFTPGIVQASAGPNDADTTSARRTATAEALRQLDDATIVAIFDFANTADIETGRLAERLGSTKEVRDFGTMLVRAHEQVRQLGRDLAKRLGVTPTPPANDRAPRDHAAAIARLEKLNGVAFDRAFLQHEVSFHAAVIDAVTTTLLPAIKNAELRDLVVKVAPAFESHRAAANHMLQKGSAAARGTSRGH